MKESERPQSYANIEENLDTFQTPKKSIHERPSRKTTVRKMSYQEQTRSLSPFANGRASGVFNGCTVITTYSPTRDESGDSNPSANSSMFKDLDSSLLPTNTTKIIPPDQSNFKPSHPQKLPNSKNISYLKRATSPPVQINRIGCELIPCKHINRYDTNTNLPTTPENSSQNRFPYRNYAKEDVFFSQSRKKNIQAQSFHFEQSPIKNPLRQPVQPVKPLNSINNPLKNQIRHDYSASVKLQDLQDVKSCTDQLNRNRIKSPLNLSKKHSNLFFGDASSTYK